MICSSCGMFSFVNCSCWFRGANVVVTVVVVCCIGVMLVFLGMPVVWSPFVTEIGIASLGGVSSVRRVWLWKLLRLDWRP